MRDLLLLLLAASQEPAKETPAYPTFEPFVASRMFAAFGDPKSADLKKLLRQLEIMQSADDAAEEAAESDSPSTTSKVSAALEPEIDRGQRMLAPLVPVTLMRLEPLWSMPRWSADEVADARAAVEILARIEGAPAPSFVQDKDPENHAGLEQLVRWFRTQVARPEWYAAMIFTWDDGPFSGLLYDAPVPLPASATKQVDDKTSLALCRVERPNEPWVLQAMRDGRPLWSRVVSAAPDESVADVAFRNTPAERLGHYGWKIQMTVSWSAGKELAEVFLDAEGKLLFYFLSW